MPMSIARKATVAAAAAGTSGGGGGAVPGAGAGGTRAAVARGGRRTLVTRLKGLHLNNAELTNAALVDLAEACRKSDEPLPLRHLWLGANRIGDIGVTSLVTQCVEGKLPSLESLLIYANPLGDGCMRAIAGAAGTGALPQLRLLCAQGCTHVTKGGRDTLRQAMAFSASQPRDGGGSGGVRHLRVYVH